MQEILMNTTRIFNNGNSQAVRLPKEFRFDEDEVVIKKLGDMVVLLPMKYRAESLLAMLEEIGPMDLERGQSIGQQDRDFE
jgi:antitoxin VapB